MSHKKLANPDWVDLELISRIPTDVIENLPDLKDALRRWNERKTRVASMPAGSLKSLEEVFQLFNLRESKDQTQFDMKDEDLYDVPSGLDDTIEKFENVFGTRENEAVSRCFINLIIVQCLADTRSSIKCDLSRQSHLNTDYKPLNLYLETELHQEVLYRNEKVMLSGFADYTFGYAQEGAGSGNLIVVEAKRPNSMGLAVPQLLAYMGMIHKARLKDKIHAVVYGATSDGMRFEFWKIDDHSLVSSSDSLRWNHPIRKKTIYTILRNIIHTAVLCSPTTSPIDNTRFEEHFNDSRSSRYDFGLKTTWDEIFTWENVEDVEEIP